MPGGAPQVVGRAGQRPAAALDPRRELLHRLGGRARRGALRQHDLDGAVVVHA